MVPANYRKMAITKDCGYWMQATTTRTRSGVARETRCPVPSASHAKTANHGSTSSGIVPPASVNACARFKQSATLRPAPTLNKHQYILGADEIPFETALHIVNTGLSKKQQALHDVWRRMPPFACLQNSMWHSIKPVNLFIHTSHACDCFEAVKWLKNHSPSTSRILNVPVDCRLVVSNLHGLDTIIFAFRNAADQFTGQIIPDGLPDTDADSDSNLGSDTGGLLDVQYRSVRLATMALREVLETVGAITDDKTGAAPFRVNVIFSHFEALERVHALSPSFLHWLFSLHSSTVRDDSSCIINAVFISTRLFGILRCMPYNFSTNNNIIPLQLHWRRFSQAECISILAADDQLRAPAVSQQALTGAISLIVDMFFYVVRSLEGLFDVCSFAISRTFNQKPGDVEKNRAETRKLLIKHANEYAGLITSGALNLQTSSSSTTTKTPVELKAQIYRSLAAAMPLLLRWTVVASFLAANNPERADQILCAKSHGRVGRRERLMRDRAKLDTNKQDHAWAGDSGKPMRISVTRIVKVVNYLLDKDDVRNLPDEKLCHCAITTLVEDGLLRVTHADDQQVALGVAKYFSMVPAALVIEVAKSINFNVADHLYDAGVLRS